MVHNIPGFQCRREMPISHRMGVLFYLFNILRLSANVDQQVFHLNQTENSSFFVVPNPVGSILIKDTYNHPNNLILADTAVVFF
jgi:hypothetical protein